MPTSPPQKLASAETFLSQEKSMAELAKTASEALRSSGLLAPEADKVSFGVGEEKDQSAAAGQPRTLPWGQLAELTKCLLVRSLLPASITPSDQKRIMNHTAQRWFSLLRSPALSKLAFGPFVRLLAEEAAGPAKVTIFSAHDSTLIGAITALRLANPSQWPEYASHLKVEVFKPEGGGTRLARFSLNGEVLRHLELEGELIPLDDVVRLALDGGGEGGEGGEPSRGGEIKDL